MQSQLTTWWALESVEELLAGQLTMTNWDTFTTLLKEQQLEGYLHKLEEKATGDPVEMKNVILKTAVE